MELLQSSENDVNILCFIDIMLYAYLHFICNFIIASSII